MTSKKDHDFPQVKFNREANNCSLQRCSHKGGLEPTYSCC